jgi:hypothetical protein
MVQILDKMLEAEKSVVPEGITESKQAKPSTQQRARPRVARPPMDEPTYVPPDFSSSRRTRIGSSFIEQFVAGHDAGDVLRELVQNEYDGGGESLTLNFASKSLEVVGSGRNIDRNGWERLSVIVGTGNVMGTNRAEVVAPKENGIGSKNFGLRSLFRFGDEIHVRSGGQVALLDLQTQETGRERDPAWSKKKGVCVFVPYRSESTERLEAFTVEREEHALDLMAASMPDTLVKLALSGKRKGLREVSIQSVRTGRVLHWKQDAKRERSSATRVIMVKRSGKLNDQDGKQVQFQEEEFSRTIEIPEQFLGRPFPAYYKQPGNKLSIAVSVPIIRRRIDLRQHGHFYYPLKAPSSVTGCALSVSAPFELNTDRSGINDHVWNDWLIDQAVELTIDLLRTDWFSRYGADAFKALTSNGISNSTRFSSKIAQHLKEGACWPTGEVSNPHFARAGDIVLPTEPELSGFLSAECYLVPELSGDEALSKLAVECGAKRFTISSLVRLRCAGGDLKGLETKLAGDANYAYTDYSSALMVVSRQKRLASALSVYPRKLTKQNKFDLGNTPSTLNALGDLVAANQLMIVSKDLWNDCPEPEANLLHPELIHYKSISSHCRTFNEDQWLIDAAGRAASASFDDRERETLYRKLLTREKPISRIALAALHNNPVVKNQRGQWVAPSAMVHLKKSLATLLDTAIDAPSKEMQNVPGLITRLRIRSTLNGLDLVRFAHSIVERPEMAERFGKLLTDNLKLLAPGIIDELRVIPCLMSRSGKLTPPRMLHLDTKANRQCIDDDDRIVRGGNDLLHRKLKLSVAPDSEILVDILKRLSQEGRAPHRPDLIYPALVEAIKRERRVKSEFSDLPICWVQGGYYQPSEILVGSKTAAPLGEVFPLYGNSDAVGGAYLALGAASHPNDTHWARFFREVGTAWLTDMPITSRQRALLVEAYRARKNFGLPAGLEDVRCLIDDRGRLFTLSELRAAKLLEPDFPELEQALLNTKSATGVIEKSEHIRAFFAGLGIRPLSAIAGASEAVLGSSGRPPFWFKPKQAEKVIAILHRPLFAHALYEIAYRNRHGHAGFQPASFGMIKGRLLEISDVSFFSSMERRYTVAGTSVVVSSQVAVRGGQICIIPPKSKSRFQFLLAEALAEIAGATSVATMRSIANAFLPLLLCSTLEDLKEYLEQMGLAVSYRSLADHEEGVELEDDDDDESGEDFEELALRQVFDNLNTSASSSTEEVQPVEAVPPQKTKELPPAPPAAPNFVLPDLDDVSLKVAPTQGVEISPRSGGGGGGGGTTSTWLPPTAGENERAARVGQRGEELVYLMELQKVRDMGYADPERYVIWTSRDEPGADHDIRSIDTNGQPRWLEVKSTTGVDGRFDWPRREFEKALRERDRYELWRVYCVADREPVAKCFPDPSRMLGTRQIALELGMLRANIEKLD